MEEVRCKYCGKKLVAVESRNMQCGMECAKKHYRPRSIIEIWEERERKMEQEQLEKVENIKMFNQIITVLNKNVGTFETDKYYVRPEQLEFMKKIGLLDVISNVGIQVIAK